MRDTRESPWTTKKVRARKRGRLGARIMCGERSDARKRNAETGQNVRTRTGRW